MRGSGCAIASSASVIGRSDSYRTSMRSSAAVAISSLAAATPATGSPTNRTLSSAKACSSWLTGRMPNGNGRTLPVSPAFQHGSARVCDMSMPVMRAWGCGLRSSLAYNMRGRNRSSANLVTPVTLAVASTLRIAFPTTRRAAGCFLRVPIQRLPRRLGLLPPQAGRRQLHRLVDLQVARAAAQVARQRLLDLVTRGSRVLVEQRFGGEQEGGRTVPALRRAELGERVLERMQRPTLCHPLDRLHAMPRAREAEHQAGEHGLPVHEHGARAALAQLAAMLRAGETHVFTQHFEQGLVRREGHFDRLAIQLEGDLRLGIGHVDVILINGKSNASFPPPSPRGRPMFRRLLLALILLAVYPSTRLPAQDFRAQALRILKTVPLIDGHNDIPDAIRQRGGLDSVDFASPQPKLMTDIPKLRAGAVGGQFWAAYVPVTTMDSGPHPAVYALEQIDLIKRLCARYPVDLAMAYSAADVERHFKAGKISCLIGIEGGHAIENSLGTLRMFAALGVRYITLTHWRSLSWATASTDTARRGLSAFGREVVHEMNRLGILVDLSHVNDGTMSDALHTTRAPIMFSHSSARALTGHARDVPDSILRLVPRNGGIVMVNFNPGFVSEAVRLYDDSMEARIRSLRATGADPTTVADSTQAWAARAPKATLAQVADHIEHIRAVAGVDAVGLGSDFDGITEVPVGLEDVSKFPDLLAELLKRGWSEQDVRKVAGLNALRVLRGAERVAAELRAVRDSDVRR